MSSASTQEEYSSSFEESQIEVLWDFCPTNPDTDFAALKTFAADALCFDVNFEPHLTEMTDDILETVSGDNSIGFKIIVAEDEGAGPIFEAVGGAFGLTTALSIKKYKDHGWARHLTSILRGGSAEDVRGVVAAYKGRPALLVTDRIYNMPGDLVPHFYRVTANDVQRVLGKEAFTHYILPVFRLQNMAMDDDSESESEPEAEAGAARPRPSGEEKEKETDCWALPEFEVFWDNAIARVPLSIKQHKDKLTTRVPVKAYALVIEATSIDAIVAQLMLETDQDDERMLDM